MEAFENLRIKTKSLIEKWRFAEYGETFQLFGCVSPSILDGLFIAHIRKPFHANAPNTTAPLNARRAPRPSSPILKAKLDAAICSTALEAIGCS